MLNTVLQSTLTSSLNQREVSPAARSGSWFAVQVKRQLEMVVASHLQNSGFETIVPVSRTRRKWSDRVKTIAVPMFPGYVFCQFDAWERMSVDLIPGVNGVISFGSKLAEVDRGEMSALKSVMAAGVETASWPKLEPGRRVSIDQGPLRGVTGVVVGDKNEERMILSVTLLNRSLSIEIDRGWFMPCND